MQRFAWKWVALTVMACGIMACANDGVGDPCVPESIPCAGSNGTNCGFARSESYVESSSVQCRSRVCIVHKLEGGAESADPRDLLGRDEGVDWDTAAGGVQTDSPNAVDDGQLNQSVYCTCRCRDGGGKKVEGCECPDGFRCEELLKLGGAGVRGSYCVRPDKKP